MTGHDHIGGVARINGITYYTLRAMVEGDGANQNSFALASFYADGSMSVKGWFQAHTDESRERKVFWAKMM